jgi:hypothetical protein
MKLVEILLRIGGRGMKQNRGGEFEWGTLYVYMEMSQWNPFVQLIHGNKNPSIYKICSLSFAFVPYHT